MTTPDYPKALAAAREAHTYVKHLGMTRAEAALGDLIAALDAARGEAVLHVKSSQLWDARVSGMNAVRADHQDSWTYDVPLFAAPPAALAVPAEPVAWQYRFATPDGLTWSDWQQISSEAMAREMVEAFGKAGTRAEWRSLKVFDWGGYAGECTDADFADERAQQPAAADEVAKHSTQDCYEHFLAYSGLEDSPWIKYAYFHGADVGLDRPSKPAPVAPADEVTDEYARAFHDGWLACERGDAEPPVPAQQPAAAVPAANVTPMRQPRLDLARLVDAISAAVYANGDGLSVTEAIGALELAKLELLKEQEQ